MRRSLIVILVGLALVAQACGDGDAATPTSAPAATTESSTVSTAATASHFPVTVSGSAGDITLQERPGRILSLSPTHTEMLYAIGAGAQIVGTDLTSNYPPQVGSTAKVDAFNFDVEEVAALQPDLVVLAFDFSGETEALAALGIPALLLAPPVTLEGAYEQVVAIGAVTGHLDEAGTLARVMQTEIDELLDTAAQDGAVTLYHEVDATLFSANSATFLGDIYSRLGLINIADEVPDEFGSGYVQLSPEFILDQDPEFVFLASTGFGESVASVAGRPGWDTLTAVREGRLVALDTELAGRWGPRTVDLVRSIAEALLMESAGS